MERSLSTQDKGGNYCKNGKLDIITTVIAVFIATTLVDTVESRCTSAITELWAYNNPSTELFSDTYTKFIHSDRGSRCQWLIISSDKEEVVEISFTDYTLKNTSGGSMGDCLRVYDGPSENDAKLLGLCNGKPKHSYVGSGRELLVVYERGERQGDRGFKMIFVSKEVLSKVEMIRIAGIVGACISAAVLIFIVLRATRCFRCLLEPKDEDGIGRDIGGSALATSARERDRLTHDDAGGEAAVSVAGMRREARRVQGSAASINQIGLSTDPSSGGSTSVNVTTEGGATSALAPLAGSGENGGAPASSHRYDPDGGSLSSVSGSSSRGSRGEGDMNELPPSYESLFLDENGDYPVEKPPDYSPPKHHRKHPPRRVHTFN